MKPLSLNLSKMKKIGSDQHSSTFLHPSGHRMVIAHSGVSSLQRKQLEKMPVQAMAEGGDVESVDPAPSPTSTPLADSPDQIAADAQSQAPAPVHVDQVQAQRANSIPGDGAPAVPPSAPSSTLASGDIAPAYQQGQQSITEQQNVDSAKAKADAAIQQKDIADRQALNQTAQDTLKDFTSHQQQFMQDYMNNHVDPRHYVENMGAVQKVATGIGLLLGGMGSATTGGPNPAMEFLNKQIDRDIKAQESRIDQQKTILGANQELYHDKVMASNQTRINMNDIYDHKIQLEATKLGTPQAKANADAAHARFAIENQKLLQESAIRATVMNHMNNGGTGLNAIDLVNAGMIPKEEGAKEQASIDAQKTAIQKTQALYNDLNKEQSAVNLLNPQSSRRVEAMNAELVNAVMNASASKRLTEESVKKEIAPLEIKTTDNSETRKAKMQGVLNIIQRHADPTPYMSHYSPGSLPKYSGQDAHPHEGKTASDAKGNRIVMRNGRWVPLGG